MTNRATRVQLGSGPRKLTTTRLRRGSLNETLTTSFLPRTFATLIPAVVALERSSGAAAAAGA